MDYFLDWPFVYDCDQEGEIYIDPENGDFYFSDKLRNWEKKYYNVNHIVNIRFDISYEDCCVNPDEDEEPSDSCINIYFNDGKYIHLFNRHNTFIP